MRNAEWAEPGSMQNAECKMQNAECRMGCAWFDAECKMQNGLRLV